MKWVLSSLLCLAVVPSLEAGDGISGPHKFAVVLSTPFERYELTPRDREWVATLVRRLRYDGQVVHFLRTTLTLAQDGRPIGGGSPRVRLRARRGRSRWWAVMATTSPTPADLPWSYSSIQVALDRNERVSEFVHVGESAADARAARKPEGTLRALPVEALE